MEPTVLITGGAGFIGCNLARHLTRAGFAAKAIDDLSLGRGENLPAEFPLTVADVAEADTWRSLPGADAVVHLAGASSAPMFPDHLADCFQNNVVGFIRVLEHARAHGARRVVYASTSSVYGNVRPPLREDGPLDIPNFYAVSKYCMEQIARMYYVHHGLDVVGVRFMSVYGPREDHKGQFANLVSQFIWDLEAGRPPVIYGDGSQTRDFTNVGDIAQAIRLILQHPEPLGSTVFNVGTGRETSLNELVSVLAELTGRPVEPEYIPNPVRTGYVRQQAASLARIQAVLGYQPSVSLRQGIQEILQLRRDGSYRAAA
jgi:UDP-glucose 4-epimerase